MNNNDLLDFAIQNAPNPEARARLEAIRADQEAFNARMRTQDMIVRVTMAGVVLMVLASLVYMAVLIVQASNSIQKETPHVRPIGSASP